MIPGAAPDGDAIEVYLDSLLAALKGTSHDVRRTLVECEAHLQEAVDQRVADGMAPQEAAESAIAAFGSVAEVSAEFNRAHRSAAIRAVAPVMAFQTWRLSAVGLLAVGISGLVSWALASIAGTSAVFADAPGTTYDRAGCAHFLAVQPTAKSCASAALLEGRDDAILQRAAAGVLGVLMLAASLWWQRRRAHRNPSQIRVDLMAPAALIGVTLFGAAGIILTGYGIDRAVVRTGSGQWISAGVVALAVAGAYLAAFWRKASTLVI